MAMKTAMIEGSSIGPSSWKNNTVRGIKMSQNIIQRSDKSCDIGRSTDPLPHLRDTLAELSNDEAHRYFREVRSVVARLRESLLETNEEIKSLTRGKEALEKSLEHRRKDLSLNRESSDIRLSRPARERDQDGADDLLKAENQHLRNLKRMLEAQLRLVQQQLQALDAARRRLANVVQERSRVLDLICHTLSNAPLPPPRITRHNSTARSGYGRSSALSMSGGNNIDPLGAYTPEADHALEESRDACHRSAQMRRDLHDAIDRANRLQKAVLSSVNMGFNGKIAETTSLRQNLSVSAGETRHALHRSQRWYDGTEKALGYSVGPVSSADMTTREHLTRPIIKVFQRHPGTNLPEAQEIVRGGDGLLDSLTATSRNIGLLKLTQLQLQQDIRDKKSGADVDSSVLRLRRRKSNHRWVMGSAF